MIELVTGLAALKSMGSQYGPHVFGLLVGYEDETAKRLKRIEKKVDALLRTPYQEALDYLGSVTDEGVSEQRRASYVARAEDRLRTAVAGFKEAQEWTLRSRAALDLAVLYLAGGRGGEANSWARQSFQAAVEAAEESIARANSRLDARFGRVALFSRPVVMGVFAVFFLLMAVGLWVDSLRIFDTRISILSMGFGAMAFISVRWHYTTAMAWWAKRPLQPVLQFLHAQREICNEIITPPHPLPRLQLRIRGSDDFGPEAFFLHVVEDGPVEWYASILRAIRQTGEDE